MTARELIHIINNGNNLSESEYRSLVQLHHEFPYFVLPSILAAKYQLENFSEKDNVLLHHSATQTPDRKRLKFLLENPIPFLNFLPAQEVSDENTDQAVEGVNDNAFPIPEQANLDEAEKETGQILSSHAPEEEALEEKNEIPLPPSTTAKKQRSDVLKDLEENLNRLKSTAEEVPPTQTDPPSDRLQDNIGDENHELKLIAEIRTLDKKNIPDDKKQIQDELIDEFNRKTVKFKIPANSDEIGESTDLSIESTRLKETLISESFAKILVKQKKTTEAKEIYRKLQLKFPDKKAYFADCLKQLENN